MDIELIKQLDLAEIDALRGTVVVVEHEGDDVATFYVTLPEKAEQFSANQFIALSEGLKFASQKIDEFVDEFYRIERDSTED